jgi:AbrB family looped-hinge helix DNA binding protein
MDPQMLTISTKGQLVIPADVRAELGIEPGSRIALTVDNARIILQPVNQRLVGRLRGRFAAEGYSMADELLRERRQDQKKDKY